MPRTPGDNPARREASRLCTKREQHEEGRENVFAAHDPGNRFHVDRQHQVADRGGHGERVTARRAKKEDKQKRHNNPVQAHVAQMIACRIAESEKAAVDRPGEVSHRKRLFARETPYEDGLNAVAQTPLRV